MTKHSKGKSSTKRYWMYGYHPVRAAILNPKRTIHRLLLTQNAAHKLTRDIGPIDHYMPEIKSSKYIAELFAADTTHQGFALQLAPLEEKGIDGLSQIVDPKAPLVLLDQVTDPQNVGAILRSVDAFYGKAIITTVRNSPSESGVLAKASSGAIERVPFIKVANLNGAMSKLKEMGYWFIGLEPEGTIELESVLEQTADAQIGMVMGAEGKGLRESVRKQCDYLAHITINPSTNSLNVSTATSVSLYSAFRIRSAAKNQN